MSQTKLKNKVFQHADRDLIIRWLSEGKSPQVISDMLVKKYPGVHNEHLRISMRTIHDFRNRFMPNGKVSTIAIQEAKVPRWSKESLEIKKELLNNTAYQEAISSIADQIIDTKKELLELMVLLKKRVEAYYNSLADASKEGKLHINTERVLIEQMKLLQQLLQQQDSADRAERVAQQNAQEVNINVNVVRDQADIIKDAVRETLDGVDPSLAIEFMERLSIKMKELQYVEDTGLIAVGGKLHV